jgi:DNA repair exonuclease SbcCD nuclease subunit
MGRENIRYCGSALHMSFSELEKKKYVLEVDLSSLKIEKIEVPVFQRMKALSGDHRTLLEELSRLRDEDVWIEAAYTGSDIIPSLSADIFAAVRGGKADVLGIRNDAILSNILEAASGETLDTLKVQDVFLRLLDANAVSGQYRKELIDCFNEIVSEMEDAV